MSSAYHLHLAENLLILRFDGCISRSENAEVIRAVLDEGQLTKVKKMLVDARGATSSELTAEDLQGLAAAISWTSSQCESVFRVALCAPEGSFAYPDAVTFCDFAAEQEGLEAALHPDMERVASWLGLTGTTAQYDAMVSGEGSLVMH